MKLANNFVEIRNNKKTITLKNMILNNYLYSFLKNIISHDFLQQYFSKCYIKIDTSVAFNKKSMIDIAEFDFYIKNPIVNEINTKNLSIIDYIFKPLEGKIYNAKNAITDTLISENEYRNKKITAIGFATNDSNYIGAIIDVSNYDIYYEDGFSIFRQDKIETEAIYYTDMPYGAPETPKHLKFLNDNVVACVSGIGFGKTPYKIEERYNIKAINYPESPTEDEMFVSFEILNDDGSHKPIYNQKNICFSYPSNNTYMPIYPTKNSYPYIMFEYEYYKKTPSMIYVEGWYWEAIKLNKYGNLKATIKYERS